MKAIFAGALFLSAAIAAAQTTITHRTFPIKVLGCSTTGNLTGTADLTLVRRSNVDENGTMHLGLTRNIHGNLMAADGTEYILVHNDTMSMNRPVASLPSTFTMTEKFFLIGLGSAPNVQVIDIFHQTVLPDGTVVSDVDFFRVVGDESCIPPG